MPGEICRKYACTRHIKEQPSNVQTWGVEWIEMTGKKLVSLVCCLDQYTVALCVRNKSKEMFESFFLCFCTYACWLRINCFGKAESSYCCALQQHTMFLLTAPGSTSNLNNFVKCIIFCFQNPSASGRINQCRSGSLLNITWNLEWISELSSAPT